MHGRIRIHMRTTGSHAKLILLDTAEDGWIAGIGSCNWLSSPFQSIELSVILRHQWAVADVALAVQRLVGRRGLSDDIATGMASFQGITAIQGHVAVDGFSADADAQQSANLTVSLNSFSLVVVLGSERRVDWNIALEWSG